MKLVLTVYKAGQDQPTIQLPVEPFDEANGEHVCTFAEAVTIEPGDRIHIAVEN